MFHWFSSGLPVQMAGELVKSGGHPFTPEHFPQSAAGATTERLQALRTTWCKKPVASRPWRVHNSPKSSRVHQGSTSRSVAVANSLRRQPRTKIYCKIAGNPLRSQSSQRRTTGIEVTIQCCSCYHRAVLEYHTKNGGHTSIYLHTVNILSLIFFL